MYLLRSDMKKIDILTALTDKGISPVSSLAKEIKTNYDTVQKNLRFMMLVGWVAVEDIHHTRSPSGRPFKGAKITERGKKRLIDIKKAFPEGQIKVV